MLCKKWWWSSSCRHPHISKYLVYNFSKSGVSADTSIPQASCDRTFSSQALVLVLVPVSVVCDILADTESTRDSGTEVSSRPSICWLYIHSHIEVVTSSNRFQLTKQASAAHCGSWSCRNKWSIQHALYAGSYHQMGANLLAYPTLRLSDRPWHSIGELMDTIQSPWRE